MMTDAEITEEATRVINTVKANQDMDVVWLVDAADFDRLRSEIRNRFRTFRLRLLARGARKVLVATGDTQVLV